MMSAKCALIIGVSGQDGSLLAKLLVNKGYIVFGTSRDAEIPRFDNLVRLGIRAHVKLRSMTLTDIRSALQVLRESQPDEIYILSGQSSVGLSFTQPAETFESIAQAMLNLLEAVRYLDKPVRIYNAASSECFGETTADAPATELTPFRPRSPYGVAKAAAFWQVAIYREAYGLHASSGILFNHESSFRPARFVTRKVVQAATRIAAGSKERLTVGETQVKRDWGFAPEYVEAMWLMLQQDKPRDYVIATGQSHTLEEFIATAFQEFRLDWREHIVVDPALFRASDISNSHGDPTLARTHLGWRARTKMRELVVRLVEDERRRLANPSDPKP